MNHRHRIALKIDHRRGLVLRRNLFEGHWISEFLWFISKWVEKYYIPPSQCFLDVYILVHFLISWSTNWVPYIFPQTLIFYISISLYFLYIYIIRICIYFHTSTPQVIFVTANTADGSVNFFQQCKFPQKTTYSIAQKTVANMNRTTTFSIIL